MTDQLSTASILGALTAEVASMRDAVSKMTKAVETLIRVETTQARQETHLVDLESRMRKVELNQPALVEMRLWIIGGFGALIMVVLGAVVTGHVGITIVR